MTDAVVHRARVVSRQSTSTEQIALVLEQASDQELGVLLASSRRQFACKAICRVLVRYDDGIAHELNAVSLDIGGVSALGFEDGPLMLRMLATTSRFRVRATMEGAGERVLEFDTRGLRWPPKN